MPRKIRVLMVAATLATGVLAGEGIADAATPGVAWSPRVLALPTSFSPTDTGDHYLIGLTNVGGATSSGLYTLVDTLPEGVTVSGPIRDKDENLLGFECAVETVSAHSVVTCTSEIPVPALTPASAGIEIPVHVSEAAGTLVNQLAVSGGGQTKAPAVTDTSTPVAVTAPPFEPLDFTASLVDASGSLETQAGGHANALTTAFTFPSARSVYAVGPPAENPVQEVRQIVTELPAGVVGDVHTLPACPLSNVTDLGHNPDAVCPRATRVGTLTLFETRSQQEVQSTLKIINVVPERGYAAEFAVYLPTLQRSALLYGTLGRGPDYPLIVVSAPQDRFLTIDGVSLTFFGNPAVADGSGFTPVATFTNSSDCSALGFTSRIHVDSWEHPARFNPDGTPDLSDPNWKSASSTAPPVNGCEQLRFNPTLSVQPTSSRPDSPSGAVVDLKIPQNPDPNGLATPPLKNATITLPRGLTLSPSAANGLQACSDEQFAVSSNLPASCPPASQIATVTVHTPILTEALPGQVFLGAPQCSPCTNADAQAGRLARGFLQIHSDKYGITVKIIGAASVNPSTGQVTVTFKNAPQQPFDELQATFPDGPRAVLATPAACGTYTTSSDLLPWSSPQTPDATPSSSFQIAGCAGNPFAPAFTAGTTSAHAGAYSPFTLTFTRSDGEQILSDVEQTLPPGMLAKLAGVTQCAAPNAAAGTCPASSRIGSVTAAAGPGSDPFYTTGSIYLTGPYNGGPFGEVVVIQALAGPFNLGTVVVRGSIRVNPTTAQATVVSDPFPTILAGIPLRVRTVNVTLDRPSFTFNATNCTPTAITGTLLSSQNSKSPVTAPYQARDCAALPFKPLFTISTAGRVSKQAGASLDVKVTSRGGPQAGGGEANIKEVKVDLPRQMPSRLTTLQKACLARVFEANPAGCPKESDVGTATAVTPLLANPLSGPVYLVSHGGAAFPDLEVVLQGEGVVLILDGHTDIKKGVTISDFNTVPDAPISSFELKLPTGKFSILGAYLPKRNNYSFCGQKLTIPTMITAQNGAVIKQTTKIAVTGCPKANKAKRSSRRAARRATHTTRRSSR